MKKDHKVLIITVLCFLDCIYNVALRVLCAFDN